MKRVIAMTGLIRFISLFAIITSFSSTTFAQQSSSAAKLTQAGQQNEPPNKTEDDPNNSGQKQINGTSNDRLFFVLPNFLTLETAQASPLSPHEKFKVVIHSSFDYVEYPWYALLAGISQAENSEPGYGQGSAGYAKRYGAAFANGTIESFMTGAILPSLLRQDPRYFQLGQGSFLHRAGYSVSRLFVTRTDSGQAQFNFSETLGSALAAGISTYSYHPTLDRNLANTANVWATQVGYDALTTVLKEFWPDIRRKLRKK
jgi:hypothetical protein